MKGISIHCHHGILWEYCHDYQERVDYIKSAKPQHEIETRLRLFKILPDEAILDLPKKDLGDEAKRCQDKTKWWQDKTKWWQDKTKRCQDETKWWQDKAKWYQDKAKRCQDETKRCQDEAKWYQDALKLKKNHKTLSAKAFHKKWCGCKEWNGKEIVFNQPKR